MISPKIASKRFYLTDRDGKVIKYWWVGLTLDQEIKSILRSYFDPQPTSPDDIKIIIDHSRIVRLEDDTVIFFYGFDGQVLGIGWRYDTKTMMEIMKG